MSGASSRSTPMTGVDFRAGAEGFTSRMTSFFTYISDIWAHDKKPVSSPHEYNGALV